MPSIKPNRLIADLRELAQFGKYKTGVHRPTYSSQDMESRHWIAGKYREAGLDAHIDGVGNVFGTSRSEGRKLLAGSHSESQNYAGWLDGALGVVYALEAARALAENPSCAGLNIEPVAWADEETHFLSLLGSRSFTGEIGEADLEAAANAYTGQTLRDALREAGLAGVPRTVIQPDRYIGYLEAHIEQGDSLEATNKRIGIVTGIVGIWQYRIAFKGIQNHAGSTRMAIRRDAGVAMVHLATKIAERFPAAADERTVWTTGDMRLDPGAASIIPGGAEMLFQIRDQDPTVLARMEALLYELADEIEQATDCRILIEVVVKGTPALMDANFQNAFEEAAERHAPGVHARMPSGASHDAQILARKIPAGMLFVPSIGGISHHWTENTTDDDIVLGCRVFVDAAENILKQHA